MTMFRRIASLIAALSLVLVVAAPASATTLWRCRGTATAYIDGVQQPGSTDLGRALSDSNKNGQTELLMHQSAGGHSYDIYVTWSNCQPLD